MVIKKADVTEEMKNMSPIHSRDIGCNAKILVLKKYRDGTFLSCLERDGERINFTRTAPYRMSGNGLYIEKADGVKMNGKPFKRHIRVDGLHNPVQHRRVRTANEVIPEQLSMF